MAKLLLQQQQQLQLLQQQQQQQQTTSSIPQMTNKQRVKQLTGSGGAVPVNSSSRARPLKIQIGGNSGGGGGSNSNANNNTGNNNNNNNNQRPISTDSLQSSISDHYSSTPTAAIVDNSPQHQQFGSLRRKTGNHHHRHSSSLVNVVASFNSNATLNNSSTSIGGSGGSVGGGAKQHSGSNSPSTNTTAAQTRGTSRELTANTAVSTPSIHSQQQQSLERQRPKKSLEVLSINAAAMKRSVSDEQIKLFNRYSSSVSSPSSPPPLSSPRQLQRQDKSGDNIQSAAIKSSAGFISEQNLLTGAAVGVTQEDNINLNQPRRKHSNPSIHNQSTSSSTRSLIPNFFRAFLKNALKQQHAPSTDSTETDDEGQQSSTNSPSFQPVHSSSPSSFQSPNSTRNSFNQLFDQRHSSSKAGSVNDSIGGNSSDNINSVGHKQQQQHHHQRDSSLMQQQFAINVEGGSGGNLNTTESIRQSLDRQSLTAQSNRMVRCRICENEVRSDWMDQHSQGCAQIHSFRNRQDEWGSAVGRCIREIKKLVVVVGVESQSKAADRQNYCSAMQDLLKQYVRSSINTYHV